MEALLIDVEVADVEKCPKLIHVGDAAYIGDGGVTQCEQTSAGFLQPAPEEGRENRQRKNASARKKLSKPAPGEGGGKQVPGGVVTGQTQ